MYACYSHTDIEINDLTFITNSACLLAQSSTVDNWLETFSLLMRAKRWPRDITVWNTARLHLTVRQLWQHFTKANPTTLTRLTLIPVLCIGIRPMPAATIRYSNERQEPCPQRGTVQCRCIFWLIRSLLALCWSNIDRGSRTTQCTLKTDLHVLLSTYLFTWLLTAHCYYNSHCVQCGTSRKCTK